MENITQRYQTIAQAYANGVRNLLSPATPDQAERTVERGAGKMPAAETLVGQAAQLYPISRSLTVAAADRLVADDPLERAEASTQLLAKALVDLQISAYLYEAAEEEKHGGAAALSRGIERGTGLPPDIEVNLSLITGAQGTAARRAERAARKPRSLPEARMLLSQSISDVLDQIEGRAGRTAQSAIVGLLGTSASELASAAGIVGMNITQALGVGDKAVALYNLFRQFFTNAYEALVTLLGPTISKAAANQVVSWANDLIQGEKFSELLEKLYQTGKTRDELNGLIDQSEVALDKYYSALQSIEDLGDQYLKQASITEKIIKVLRLLPVVPALALPGPKLLLNATLIILAGYVIYAGADYVDAPGMKKLDRIPGPRKIIDSTLSTGQAGIPAGSAPPEEEKPRPRRRRSFETARPEPVKGIEFEEDIGTSPSFERGPAESRSPSRGISFSLDESAEPVAEAGESKEGRLIEERIRMDLAVPGAPVVVGRPFDIAVAIRQPESALLQEDGLDKVSSAEGTLYRHTEHELVQFRVKVSAPDCEIESPEYTFLLRAGRDSEPVFFQLTPKRTGAFSILVTAYQEGNLVVAQKRVQVQALVEAVEQPSREDTRNQMKEDLEQQSTPLREKSRPTYAGREYINFDVDLFNYQVDNNGMECFQVRVECPELAGEQKYADADQVMIPSDLRRKLGMLKRRAMQDDELIDLGKTLGSMLLPQKAREFYKASRAQLNDERALRIRIMCDSYALANIAWEFAYLVPPDINDPGYADPDGFLSLDHQVSLVRYEVMGKRVGDLDPVNQDKLRMVLMLANSSDPAYPPLNLSQEQTNIAKALKNVPMIHLDPYPDATIQVLQDALVDSTHIFHFAGHGTFQGELGPVRGTLVGEGFLVLAATKPEEGFFSARKLALNLKGRGVRLAVLGICEGGERDPVNAWTGIAPALARAGIPAVVAMQFSVYDDSAVAFHHSVYQALAAGKSIDEAVSDGRLAIFSQSNPGRDWGTPVLYLRALEGALFPSE